MVSDYKPNNKNKMKKKIVMLLMLCIIGMAACVWGPKLHEHMMEKEYESLSKEQLFSDSKTETKHYILVQRNAMLPLLMCIKSGENADSLDAVFERLIKMGQKKLGGSQDEQRLLELQTQYLCTARKFLQQNNRKASSKKLAFAFWTM